MRARRYAGRGITIVEFVVVALIAAVLGVIAITLYQPETVKARYQAELLRTDLRRAQTLAMVTSQLLRFDVSGGTYTVSTVGASCAVASTFKDPVTNENFSVTVDSALALSATQATIYFDMLGRPARTTDCSGATCSCTPSTTDPAASYTVAASGYSYTVDLRPITGFATAP